MRTVQLGLIRTVKDGLSCRFQQPHSLRTLSTNALRAVDENDEKTSNNLFEYIDDIKRSISGQRSSENRRVNAFFEKVDNIGKDLNSLDTNRARGSREKNRSDDLDGLDESFESLQDGSSGKLVKAAVAFGFGDLLDGDKPGLGNEPQTGRRRIQGKDREVTTAEALRKADFRNTRFLAKFITEGGIIIKRRQTGISAKAQRKIAREIKTARSFGLLPFTTQGTKSFAFGRPMYNFANEYEDVNFGGLVGNDMSTPTTDFVVQDPRNTVEI